MQPSMVSSPGLWRSGSCLWCLARVTQ